MDEANNRLHPWLGLRAALGLLAVVIAAAAFWVTSAFAADGSAASDRTSSDSAEAAYVQDDGSDGAASDRDCPDRDGESEQSSDA